MASTKTKRNRSRPRRASVGPGVACATGDDVDRPPLGEGGQEGAGGDRQPLGQVDDDGAEAGDLNSRARTPAREVELDAQRLESLDSDGLR